jgi:hypothetical protein
VAFVQVPTIGFDPATAPQTTLPAPKPPVPAPPQHAVLVVHRLLVTWQPLLAWHALPPPGVAAQFLLQHESEVAQGSPSIVQTPAPRLASETQDPPEHWPVQQSEPVVHVSLSAWHPRGPLALMQTLPLQVWEQQSVDNVHVAPRTRHAAGAEGPATIDVAANGGRAASSGLTPGADGSESALDALPAAPLKAAKASREPTRRRILSIAFP